MLYVAALYVYIFYVAAFPVTHAIGHARLADVTRVSKCVAVRGAA